MRSKVWREMECGSGKKHVVKKTWVLVVGKR